MTFDWQGWIDHERQAAELRVVVGESAALIEDDTYGQVLDLWNGYRTARQFRDDAEEAMATAEARARLLRTHWTAVSPGVHAGCMQKAAR